MIIFAQQLNSQTTKGLTKQFNGTETCQYLAAVQMMAQVLYPLATNGTLFAYHSMLGYPELIHQRFLSAVPPNTPQTCLAGPINDQLDLLERIALSLFLDEGLHSLVYDVRGGRWYGTLLQSGWNQL